MVVIGFFMFTLIVVGLILLARNALINNKFSRFILRVMIWSIPLPYIACIAGWYVTEHGLVSLGLFIINYLQALVL